MMAFVSKSKRSSAVALLLLNGLLWKLVNGEIRSFSGRINAASTYIHYSEGYLVAPGFVDLSDLVFTTAENNNNNNNKDNTNDDGGGDKEKTNDGDNGDRTLEENADAATGSTVDVVFFHEPEECAYTRKGCDWTKLGIGASDDEGGLRWCCSNDAIDLGYCEGGQNQYGRLIIQGKLFKGQHRFIPVPPTGEMETTVKYGKLEEPNQSGKYVMVIANCNDAGRDVFVQGQYTWKSAHGYLPGDLFGEMYFFAALTALYFVLLAWYGISIKRHEDSIIPIQPWILGTIGMGFLETFFKTGDFFVWNVDGTRFWFAMYTGVLLGVLKRSISLCLIVMVSLGWGVIRDSLGSTLRKIVILGVIYAGVSGAWEIMNTIAITELETLSIEHETEIFDIMEILTFVVAALDVTFYIWILDSLGSTMQYLENMNQTRKLKRYLRLRCILLLSILFAVMWAVFSLVDTYMEETILEQENRWAVDAAMELNYLFVLTSVAILWRPNPNAKDYAFTMELPAVNSDGEVMLEAGAIPSAADDDDDDDDDLALDETTNGTGYRDDPDEDDGLPVDDGVRT